MTAALTIYAGTFMRYALAVTPKNYLLFACHFVNFGAQSTQGYRYLNHYQCVKTTLLAFFFSSFRFVSGFQANMMNLFHNLQLGRKRKAGSRACREGCRKRQTSRRGREILERGVLIFAFFMFYPALYRLARCCFVPCISILSLKIWPVLCVCWEYITLHRQWTWLRLLTGLFMLSFLL